MRQSKTSRFVPRSGLCATIPSLCLCLSMTVVFSSGCAGPTKAGLEARDQARDRLDLINTQITFQQAEQAFKVGRFDRALKAVDAAIERYPDAAEYHILRGRIMLETNRLEPAIRAFRQASELDPENARAHYLAGIVLQRWSDDEAAHNEYAKAHELEPTRVEYLQATAETLVWLDRISDAKELIIPQLAQFEHNSALQHLLGQIARMEGNLEEAASRFEQAQLLSPDDEGLLRELAFCQFDAGKYEAALASVKKLQVQLAKPDPKLLLVEARCLALLTRNIDARNVYKQLTQMTPDDAQAWIEFGTVAWELGDYHRVAQCSLRAMSLAPTRYEGYMLKGLNERHHGNMDGAINLLSRAADMAPDQAMPQVLLGLALEDAGKRDSAMVAYQRAIQAEPEHVEARSLLNRLQAVTSVPVNR